jgi:ABC-type Mn2+/Zn2+ transport system ATPase subunit
MTASAQQRAARARAANGSRASWMLSRPAAAGLRLTKQRERLVRVIAERRSPFAPEVLVYELRPLGVGRATVYRALERMERLGMLARVRVGASHPYTVCDEGHHHHLVCSDGEAIDTRRAKARVAYVPQRNEVDWDFPISVEEVVLLGRQGRLGLLGRPGPAQRAAAAAALERMNMTDFRRAQIGELSGGQQQRVFLARALAQGGDTLLLEEPLCGVDSVTQQVVVDLMDELRRAGHSIVIATHDLPQAAHVCDEVCLLCTRMVAFGQPNAVLNERNLATTYGGHALLQLSGPSHVLVA